ncbi:hypothetical protein GQ457_11G023910 [Hibiscus cannabinus]
MVAPVPAYTWTFEPAGSSREGTPMVAIMLQHSGAHNRQKCRKEQVEGYFAAHMAFPVEFVPHVKGIFSYSFRELKRELERESKEEKVKRGDLRERRLAAASSSTSRNRHC